MVRERESEKERERERIHLHPYGIHYLKLMHVHVYIHVFISFYKVSSSTHARPSRHHAVQYTLYNYVHVDAIYSTCIYICTCCTCTCSTIHVCGIVHCTCTCTCMYQPTYLQAVCLASVSLSNQSSSLQWAESPDGQACIVTFN